MMKRLFISSLLSLSLLSQAVAFVVPPNSGWVTDLADIFTPQQEVDITTKLTAIASWFDAEIAVLTLPSLDGEEIDMVGTQIAQERWIGNKERDTWVLVLIAPNERKWRIDVGYGLEWNLPDAYAYRYGENYLVPAFKEWRYADGVSALLTKFEEHLDGKPDDIQEISWTYALWLIFWVWCMFMFSLRLRGQIKERPSKEGVTMLLSDWKRQLANMSSETRKHVWMLFGMSGVYALSVHTLIWYGWVQLFVCMCIVWFLCYSGYIDTKWRTGTSLWGGGTFSGGFGGFGGGSFGGGGASWGR